MTNFKTWADQQVANSEKIFDNKFREYMCAGGDLSYSAVDAWISAGCPAIVKAAESATA